MMVFQNTNCYPTQLMSVGPVTYLKKVQISFFEIQ